MARMWEEVGGLEHDLDKGLIPKSMEGGKGGGKWSRVACVKPGEGHGSSTTSDAGFQ